MSSRLAALAALALCSAFPLAAQQAPAAHPAPRAYRPTMRRDTSLVGIDTTSGKVDYKREVFHYGGGTRDPFQTLITAGGVGPTINDLRLVAVSYDPQYGRSVAIIRETKGDRLHRLHRGDTVGRLRVLQIRQYEVVFQIEEFGFERQVVLTLQRQAEAGP
jgi:hypothetical protein